MLWSLPIFAPNWNMIGWGWERAPSKWMKNLKLARQKNQEAYSFYLGLQCKLLKPQTFRRTGGPLHTTRLKARLLHMIHPDSPNPSQSPKRGRVIFTMPLPPPSLFRRWNNPTTWATLAEDCNIGCHCIFPFRFTLNVFKESMLEGFRHWGHWSFQ